MLEIDRPERTAWPASTRPRRRRWRRCASGVDVIYQATFFDGRWRGHADFLRRVETASELGPWSYEAHDTKLARRTKAATLLQLGEYSRQVARLQGRAPRSLHVVLGDGTVEEFLFADIAAYLRDGAAPLRGGGRHRAGRHHPRARPALLVLRLEGPLRRAVAAGGPPLPGRRVAPRPAQPPGRRRASPRAPRWPRCRRAARWSSLRAAALDGAAAQARLQLESEREGALAWELIDPDPTRPHRGLAGLPGAVAAGHLLRHGGRPVRRPRRPRVPLRLGGGRRRPARRSGALWAHDPAAEKAAFERFIDTVVAARARDPGMHVYHYASYEPPAMKRLMGRYATREDEVDALLRAGVFVDLYRVVRQGVRVGAEFVLDQEARAAVHGAARRRRSPTRARASCSTSCGSTTPTTHILESIRLYNEDDCRSLVGLRAWLEERRSRAGEPPRAAAAAAGERGHGVGGGGRSPAPPPPTASRPSSPRGSPSTRSSGPPSSARSRCSPLSSTGTAATPSRRGGSTSRARTPRTRSSSTTPPRSAAWCSTASWAWSKKSRLFRFTFPPQETKLHAGDGVEDPRTVPNEAGKVDPARRLPPRDRRHARRAGDQAHRLSRRRCPRPSSRAASRTRRAARRADAPR